MQKIDLHETYYEIYDVRGKLMQKANILNTKTKIDMEKWAVGIFKVKVFTKKENFVMKIVKQ